jgi:hypothetical protein
VGASGQGVVKRVEQKRIMAMCTRDAAHPCRINNTQ